MEIDQATVVQHAADRQKHIEQGQSVNLFFPGTTDRGYVNEVHLLAWSLGLKGLYYLRTEAKSRAENVSEKVERVALVGDDDNATIIYGHQQGQHVLLFLKHSLLWILLLYAGNIDLSDQVTMQADELRLHSLCQWFLGRTD
jgi:ribonucleotide reductase alpha subunit